MPDPEFLLLGDALWLEFVNTVATPTGGSDALPDSGAYLRWTKSVRVEPPGDSAAFEDALRFRVKLLNLARALDGGRNPPPAAIEAINSRLLTLEGRRQLVRIGGAWHLRFAPSRPPTALEAVALSAAETLANPLTIVRHCANPDCGLFFADESANQGRRWCSRSRCGQRGRIERRRGTRPAPLLYEG
jgi:predicted RNA-binding Zn ribbon-like protein